MLAEEEYQSLKKAQENAEANKQKRLQFFGDIRIRHESRAANSMFPIAEAGGASDE